MDVNEAATLLGVSPRRVRAMIASGALSATKVGGRWDLEDVKPPRGRRPLSSRSRALLAEALQHRTLEGLTGQERARTAARIRALREAQDPAELLIDWWAATVPEVVDYTTSLVANAIAGDRGAVLEELHRPKREYLRSRNDLAEVVSSERTIQGTSRRDLAERAHVPLRTLTAIEHAQPVDSVSDVRRLLRALDVEPTALPDLERA